MTATKEFVWKSADGSITPISQMDDGHLLNTIRLIWNHRCPAGMEQKPNGVRAELMKWPVARVRSTLKALVTEAGCRGATMDHQELLGPIWDHYQNDYQILS